MRIKEKAKLKRFKVTYIRERFDASLLMIYQCELRSLEPSLFAFYFMLTLFCIFLYEKSFCYQIVNTLQC